MSNKRLPEWFRNLPRKTKATQKLSAFLEQEVPNSVCQEAKCPNRGECFGRGILTFLILGTVCTRNCAFCSIRHGKPLPVDTNELTQIIHSVQKLNLKFVVLTSPNRDDLEDGGASHYAYIINGIKENYPHVRVEVLIPDFQGNKDHLQVVLNAKPDVLNHNIETVPSLYTEVRKGSLYNRSMNLLQHVKEVSPRTLTKTGIMLGLGETDDELHQAFKEIAEKKVDILTLGQYLRPTRQNAEVKKYYTPEEFETLKKIAESSGIRYVFSGPLVRSSYLADHVFDELIKDTHVSV